MHSRHCGGSIVIRLKGNTLAYETKYCCDSCNHIFYKITDYDPRKKGGRAPACTECKKKKVATKSQIKVRGDVKPQTEETKSAKINDIIEAKKFPSSGKSNFTKAMDETAKIVMEDYGMTNLNDNLREGDNMVPKLRPDLEEKVGKGFGSNQKNNVMGMAGNNLNNSIKSMINSNKFANQTNTVDRAMSVVAKPTTRIIGEYTGKE